MTISECQTPRRPRPPPPTPSNVLAQFTLRSKVICITGASSGIGAAVAEAMAEAGGHLALWYNSNDAAISRGQELSSKHDVTVRAYKVQVSDPEEVKRALGKVVEDFGKVDVFVANAGMAISKPILEQSLEEYREQMAVNGEFYSMCCCIGSEKNTLWRCRQQMSLRCLLTCFRLQSGWRILLCKICWRNLSKAGVWQPHHHVEHICSHCQCAC